MRTGESVRADAVRVGGRGVVADIHGSVESRVESRHHAAVSRPGAHDVNVFREEIDQKIFSVAVGIADHDFGGAGIFRGLDGGECFVGHEAAKTFVFEPGGAELIGGDHAGDAFHVDGDVDFQFRRYCLLTFKV